MSHGGTAIVGFDTHIVERIRVCRFGKASDRWLKVSAFMDAKGSSRRRM